LTLAAIVYTRLYHQTLEEYVEIIKRLADVLERLSLRLAAINPDDIIAKQVREPLLEMGLQRCGSDRALAHNANPNLWALLVVCFQVHVELRMAAGVVGHEVDRIDS
jgi:hypothetical protein